MLSLSRFQEVSLLRIQFVLLLRRSASQKAQSSSTRECKLSVLRFTGEVLKIPGGNLDTRDINPEELLGLDASLESLVHGGHDLQVV